MVEATCETCDYNQDGYCLAKQEYIEPDTLMCTRWERRDDDV